MEFRALKFWVLRDESQEVDAPKSARAVCTVIEARCGLANRHCTTCESEFKCPREFLIAKYVLCDSGQGLDPPPPLKPAYQMPLVALSVETDSNDYPLPPLHSNRLRATVSSLPRGNTTPNDGSLTPPPDYYAKDARHKGGVA